MKELFEGLFIAFVFSSIVFLQFFVLRRFYYFYKGYSREISEFLKDNSLLLIEVKKPNSNDWKVNPFENKDSNIFEFAFPFSIKTHYFFIVENQYNETIEYWIRNSTPLFGKIKTEFKIAKTERHKTEKTEYLKNEENNYLKGKCPACSEKIEKNSKECQNCGLIYR